MNVKLEEDELIICLEGRISSDNAKRLEGEIQGVIDEHSGKVPVFDLGAVEYISSAGLRMFLSFAKQFKDKITLKNVLSEVYEVFSVTGFTALLNVEKKLREISVEGCAVLGKGAGGIVYRIDNETIVKVYTGQDSKQKIEDGQARAKYALVRGVPTAIAFDRVRVGENEGAVYELLDAKTFQEIVSAQPERLPEMTELYFQFLRQLNDLTAEKSGDLESATEVYLRRMEKLRGFLPEEILEGICSLLKAMPEDLHIVHGDLHMKNLMFCNEEPMVIDMDTLCVGNKVFEIGRLMTFYRITCSLDENFEHNFFNFQKGFCSYILEKILEDYPDSKDRDKLMLIGYMDMAYIAVYHAKKVADETRKIFLQKSEEQLKELLPKIDSLVL